MRNAQNGRRRGRGGPRPPQGGGRSPDMGNRMEVRVRGNAHQLLEKYKSLARDAASQGDRVTAEYYMQYADHYYRVLNEFRARQEEQRARYRQDDQNDQHDQGDDGDMDDGDIEEGVDGGMRGPDPIAVRAARPQREPVEEVSSAGGDEGDDSGNEPVQAQDDGNRRRRRPRGRPRRDDGESQGDSGEVEFADA